MHMFSQKLLKLTFVGFPLKPAFGYKLDVTDNLVPKIAHRLRVYVFAFFVFVPESLQKIADAHY